MKKWKKIYENNLIIHFGMSYIAVLLMPIVVILVGIIVEIGIVKNDIEASNSSKLEHSVQLIDKEIIIMESLATQIVWDDKIVQNSSINEVNGEAMLEYRMGISNLSQIMKYQNVSFMSAYYVYYPYVDCFAFDGSLYREHIMEKYIANWNIPIEEWKEKVIVQTIRQAQYVNIGENKLHYVMPIQYKDGSNQGAVVFLLDAQAFADYFSFAEEYGQYSVYVLNDNNQIMYQKEKDDNREINLEENRITNIFPNTQESNIIHFISPYKGWHYYLLLPDEAMAKQLFVLKVTLAAVIAITILVGVFVSIKFAIRMGKPIDKLFVLFNDENTAEHNSERLGEMVKGIVQSNKMLQEEVEKGKPLLKKAFFHDLITLDVTSTNELNYLAHQAGINIKDKNYAIASVRLFSSNDYYDIDEQTLLAAKTIIQNMQQYMEEISEGNVWFYQRNYLTLLVIFESNDAKEMMQIVQRTHEWLRDELFTESDWGISSRCKHIVSFWRNCEEAEIARKHCDLDTHIQEYDADFEDTQAFYFPDIAREKLDNGIKAGDMVSINSILAILERENFRNRNLSRNSLLKFNTHIVQLLDKFRDKDKRVMQYIMELNHIIIDEECFSKKEYFNILSQSCRSLCGSITKEKSIQRSKLIDDIKRFLEDNYQNSNLGLATISVAFGISEGYASALFKEQTNINFTDYIEQMRIDKASNLLKQSELSIEEIALQVGYNSVHSFRRAFKRVKGASPKYYR